MMIRFLNIVQGVTSVVCIFLAAILGWPISVILVGFVGLIIASLIVFATRKDSPKGRARETIEIVFNFISFAAILWFAADGNILLSGVAPRWYLFLGLPSIFFNLGIVVAWVCWIGGYVLGYAQEAFEFISGERVRGKA